MVKSEDYGLSPKFQKSCFENNVTPTGDFWNDVNDLEVEE